jgi:hypothetical protein
MVYTFSSLFLGLWPVLRHKTGIKLNFLMGTQPKEFIQQTFSVERLIFADFFALDVFDLQAFENSVGKSAHSPEG